MSNTNLVQLVKKCAMDAFKASKPCDFITGVVASKKPLKVKLSQNTIIPEEFLIYTKTIEENPLKKGENVILLRKQGGQKYLILDRAGGANDTE